ncbi:carboxymuconolactone decarboxylase family protein [Dyadobacter sp. NIV53]|uniref:carboxymuconolactone decarboxylase family protein n=1 Tax=Dyadobacter sp. NIV53 TaxID=2861765 RepID=UPI00286E1BB4|nr:carboxymuconolactone decarboxylase family protein [Dyadobacter sp. NIV53]
MPHIPLPSHLPGITGLLEYRKDTAAPIRVLTQILLRGESTLTPGERELIATVVSHNNECTFCTSAHTAAADLLFRGI